MIFLSGADTPGLRDAAARGYPVGLMAQPGSSVHRRAGDYRWYACDNGCFSQGARFDLGRFVTWLAGLGHRDRCLFAVAPDVYGDGAATLARSLPALPAIRALGYPAALVAQPGSADLPLPWGQFDALFVGGPDEWQQSEGCDALVREAKARGLWVHRGRVNSGPRVRASAARGFDSCDGTFLKYGPEANLPRLLRWLDDLARQPSLL